MVEKGLNFITFRPSNCFLFYPTIFTILPGTTITFLGARPANCTCVFSLAITASSIASLLKSNDNSIVKRVFPLKETPTS